MPALGRERFVDFPVGAAVKLHGLSSRPDLEGSNGVVTNALNTETGRIEVALVNGQVVRVHPDKLAHALELEVGQTVALAGLTSRADLNGKTGKLLGFNSSSSRWEVELADEAKTRINAKRSNLVPSMEDPLGLLKEALEFARLPRPRMLEEIFKELDKDSDAMLKREEYARMEPVTEEVWLQFCQAREVDPAKGLDLQAFQSLCTNHPLELLFTIYGAVQGRPIDFERVYSAALDAYGEKQPEVAEAKKLLSLAMQERGARPRG